MANSINISQEVENQIKIEDLAFTNINTEQSSEYLDESQLNQRKTTFTCNDSNAVEKIKDEFEKEICLEFGFKQEDIARAKGQPEKLIFELDHNLDSINSSYTQFKCKDYNVSEQLLELIKKCDMIYSKQRISNQDIDKLLKVSEDFIDHYYSYIDKNELGEDFDWFAELSELTCIKKEKIKLIIKLSTRLNMFVCLADSKHFKEVVKFLDLDHIANMNNLNWKLLHGRMLDIYSWEY